MADMMIQFATTLPPYQYVDSYHPLSINLAQNVQWHTNKPFMNAVANIGDVTGKTQFPIVLDPYILNPNGARSEFTISVIENGKPVPKVTVGSGMTSFNPNVTCDDGAFVCTNTWTLNTNSFSVRYWPGMAVIPIDSTLPLSFTFEVPVQSAIFQNSDQRYDIHLTNNEIWFAYLLEPNMVLKPSGNTVTSGKGSLLLTMLPKDPRSTASVLHQYAKNSDVISMSVNVLSDTQYSFTFKTKSPNKPFLQYIYPHQFLGSSYAATGLIMSSGSKGPMNAVLLDGTLTCSVDLVPAAVDISFPLNPTGAQNEEYKKTVLSDFSALVDALALNVNWDKYIFGKTLFNFAQVCILAYQSGSHQILEKCVSLFSKYFDIVGKNEFYAQFVMDSSYSGFITFPEVKQQRLFDIGNEFYENNHHNFGYFLYAISVYHHLAPGKAEGNQGMIDFALTILRDSINPSSLDAYFPKFRRFDFYNGHGWDSGIRGDMNGKKISEVGKSLNFFYSCMLFGKEFRNLRVENGCKLMLSILRKTFNTYFLTPDIPADLYQLKRETVVPNDQFAYASLFKHMYPVTPATIWMFATPEGKNVLQNVQEALTKSTAGFAPHENLFYVYYSILLPQVSYCDLLSSKNSYFGEDVTRSWALFASMINAKSACTPNARKTLGGDPAASTLEGTNPNSSVELISPPLKIDTSNPVVNPTSKNDTSKKITATSVKKSLANNQKSIVPKVLAKSASVSKATSKTSTAKLSPVSKASSKRPAVTKAPAEASKSKKGEIASK